LGAWRGLTVDSGFTKGGLEASAGRNGIGSPAQIRNGVPEFATS
jgi:hypothetical protein